MGRSWATHWHGIFAIAFAILLWTACGGNSASTTAGITPGLSSPAPAPTAGGTTSGPSLPVQHMVVVVEENHSYESVIGSLEMPYLNSLANRYALATSYYADTHPSIGNYFMMTTGAIVTNDDAFTGTVSSDNLARTLNAAGKTWKVYAESIPSVGYLGGDAYPYSKHHNPFAYFSDVVSDPAQAKNIVPFGQFAADVASGSLPNVSFVVPNLIDDGHDGTLVVADLWLHSNIDMLVNNAAFQQSGLLLIVFDESVNTDKAYGGGHVAAVLVGNKAKAAYKSTTLFQHASALRLMLESIGVSHLPGASAGAPAMSEMIQ